MISKLRRIVKPTAMGLFITHSFLVKYTMTIEIELDLHSHISHLTMTEHWTYIQIHKGLLEDLEHSGKAKWMVILTFWLFVYNFPTEQICFQQEWKYHSVSCNSVKQPITFIACSTTKKQLPGFVMQNILTLEGVSKWFMIV